MNWPLTGAPYEVQSRALAAARGQRSFAYFMEMGLGKTATVLAEAALLRADGRLDGMIVICPNSLKKTWVEEARKWGAPVCLAETWPNVSPSTIPVFHRLNMSPGTFFLYAVNYEGMITKRGKAWLDEMLKTFRVMLVLDESVHIKNPQAQRTKVLLKAAGLATFRRILSGAPLVQGPQDLWAQMRFIDGFPANKMNYYAFRNHFCVMGGWQGKQVIGKKNENQLTKYLAACAYRAKKDEWTDIPAKIYVTRDVELTPDQERIYGEMKKGFVAMVSEQRVTAPMVITQMLKLQQISSGFLINAEGKAIPIPGRNPKLQAVLDIIEETTGKVLIFTYFRYSARKLHDAIPGSFLILAGEHDGPDHDHGKSPIVQDLVNVFNEVPLHRVMIVQVQTGKYGLTILGGPGDDRCATTIFYENSFSLDSRIQAEDRNHRIGQDQPVVYIDLVASDIDRKAIRALTKKQNVAEAIIDGLRKG